MSQEEEDLVYPQDDIDYEAQKREHEASKTRQEEEAGDKYKLYDSDAEKIDSREEAGLRKEQVITPREEHIDKQKSATRKTK